jgi:hypothetical protein
MNISVAALDGGKVDVHQTEIEELGTRLRGTTLPGDSGNADGRGVFNAMHTAEPAFTVRCAGTSDVVEAVRFARERGLLVAVRGGGHSIAGLSTVDGGMLIDLSTMSAVVVDPDRRLADAQGARCGAMSTVRRSSSAWLRPAASSRTPASPGSRWEAATAIYAVATG